ncbi:polysaccharide deacetylase family protein [Kitasatospora sp. NPDC001175]|uniref:polysaccharide deacetylase family protein n=1 Tax=Kitasatospora sp. NPDC001175 TaxID=3157103 RepID=UPI003CFD884D
MRIPSPRSPLVHALGYGLAVLLAPVLLAGCSPADPHAAGPAAPGASGSAAATPSAMSSSAAAPPAASPAITSAAPSARGRTSAAPAPTPTPDPPGSTAPAPPPAASAPGGTTSIVYRAASAGRTVALTFDDGPSQYTGQILDLLAQYGAHATFCQIGPQASARPAVVKRVLAEGHRLCDHTVHHPQPMHTLSHERQAYEIAAAKEMIGEAGGPGTEVAWFRAPGGDFSAENRLIAVQHGMRPLGWSVDTRDWSRPGVASIVAAVQHGLRPGGVVLMHDGGGDRSQTVAALRQLLPWLTTHGYTFDFPAT